MGIQNKEVDLYNGWSVEKRGVEKEMCNWIKLNKTNSINLPLQGASFSTSIIPGRRFALPRADINWACSPKKGVCNIQNVNQLKQHVG